MYNYLNDKNFLDDLFYSYSKEIFVRITALTFNETPVECIEGKAIDGSISIDGSSAVRRTCSLTLVAEDVNIHDYYWGVKDKFKLEIGLSNNIDTRYPDIIWFKQGIYVITQFNTTQDISKWTIKIQGKDKMCLLNGDVSGNLPFNVDFANEEYIDSTGKSTFTPVPIKMILQKALIEFGKEMSHNVIINNIDESGLELLEYRGEDPLFLVKSTLSGEYVTFFLKTNSGYQSCYYDLKETISAEQYSTIPEHYNFLRTYYKKSNNVYVFDYQSAVADEEYSSYFDLDTGLFKGTVADDCNITYDDLLDDAEFVGGEPPTEIRFNLAPDYSDNIYTLIKFNTGDVPGYRAADLIFGGELKASIGDSITSVLDKIKNKFTNFEYFYDLDGKFVFQKKKEYLVTEWNKEDSYNKYFASTAINDRIDINLTGNFLVTSVANNPKLTELKNDYSVWGARDNLAIHMRYAIDNKPTSYKPIRPLKEKHITFIRDKNGNLLDTKIEEKFYNAPEIEPYNEEGLISAEIGYKTIILIEQYRKDGLSNMSYYQIRDALSSRPEWNTTWKNLFKLEDRYYHYKGTNRDLQNMVKALHEQYSIYDNINTFSVIPYNEQTDSYEEWHIICPYYANYPYSVEDVYKTDQDGIKTLIHHKVDWRELIYQMALDYRKLNYTDNYFYYLTEQNPHFQGKTGYEQYYIDLEGFWRLLYNPNPSPIFTDPLSYKDVTLYSLLENADDSDDSSDLLYIKNGYKSLNSLFDLENTSVDSLYVISTPNNETDEALYPFVKSQECCLENGSTYYVTSSESEYIMESIPANDTNYSKLNTIPLNDIYIKKNSASVEYDLFVNKKHEDISDVSNYFVKEPNYIKLSDIKVNHPDTLWELIYASDLYPISCYSTEYYNKFVTLETNKNILDISYIETLQNDLKAYVNKLFPYNFTYILKVFHKYYYHFINDLQNRLSQLFTNTDYLNNSCLSHLLTSCQSHINVPLIETYTKENLINNFSTVADINLYIAILLRSIKDNISQVNFILTQKEDLRKYATESTFDKQQLTTIINNLYTVANVTPDLYEHGAVSSVRDKIKTLRSDLNGDRVSAQQALSRINNILNELELLETCVTHIQTILFQAFSSVDGDGYVKNNYFNYLKNFLEKIQNLYNIFSLQSLDTIQDAVYFRGNALLNISSKIKNATDFNTAMDILLAYKTTTLNFQENFIRYTINNFNDSINNEFIYEPIQYYLATFGFNNNVAEGNFWSKDIFENPRSLIFWFDFLDPGASDLAKYSVPAVGTRTKVVNDKDVKIIHHEEIPNIIFMSEDTAQFIGYSRLQIDDRSKNLFVVSSKGKTAKERLDELLYNHSYCQESINLSMIPVYTLDANDRLNLDNKDNNINGEYLINKITIPLNYKKMMSITAIKSVNSIT